MKLQKGVYALYFFTLLSGLWLLYASFRHFYLELWFTDIMQLLVAVAILVMISHFFTFVVSLQSNNND